MSEIIYCSKALFGGSRDETCLLLRSKGEILPFLLLTCLVWKSQPEKQLLPLLLTSHSIQRSGTRFKLLDSYLDFYSRRAN